MAMCVMSSAKDLHQSSCAMMAVECDKGCGCSLFARDVPSHNCVPYLRQEKNTIEKQDSAITCLKTLIVTLTAKQDSAILLKHATYLFPPLTTSHD